MTAKKVNAADAPSASKAITKRKAARAPKRLGKADYHVRFFVADDIRLDADGKPMLIGLFPDNRVGVKAPASLIPTEKAPIHLSALTFMFTISAPPGGHEAAIKLELGGKGVEAKVVLNKFTTSEENRSFNLIARAQPLPVFGFGRKKVQLIVDGHDFSEYFEIHSRSATQ